MSLPSPEGFYNNITFLDCLYSLQQKNSVPFLPSIEIHSSISLHRHLGTGFSYFWNDTFDGADEFASQLKPASDISVDAVMTSIYFNAFVFIFAMALYEVLRRLFPSVYASKRVNSDSTVNNTATASFSGINAYKGLQPENLAPMPEDSYVPFDWVLPVFGVSWSRVRKTAGLDAYFFLRFIRMNVRITTVSTFWAVVILAPVFATGPNQSSGWYHLSMSNINSGTWRMWVPVIFMYFFSAFIFFVMKQEYAHYMELRMDFLGRDRGGRNVDPQHHYSLLVEDVPMELRSDRALFDYFDKLFPGKVHSASVVMKLPELETLSLRRLRVTRRLEKSIAYFYATGERSSHVLGRSRVNICGIDLAPLDFTMSTALPIVIDDEGPYPPRGVRVDSISYYTRDLAECNRELFLLQQQKTQIAHSGNVVIKAKNWFTKAIDSLSDTVADVLDESLEDNDLKSPQDLLHFMGTCIPQAEQMTSQYGSFGFSPGTPVPLVPRPYLSRRLPPREETSSSKSKGSVSNGNLPINPSAKHNWDHEANSISSNEKSIPLVDDDHLKPLPHLSTEEVVYDVPKKYVHPGTRNREQNLLRRIAGRLGLDFLFAGLKYLNRTLDMMVESVMGSNMSSTGFVTFLDLTSVTNAASVPLTHKPNILTVTVAPEQRDLRWTSAFVSTRLAARRELFANLVLCLGVILWSLPLTAIQAFATAEQVASLPGMEWVLTFDGGNLSAFINGYLPVVALLTLIMLLPVVFEQIALRWEHRKTFSDVQRSMMGRYFYYQLANIYITVTAGSLWISLAEIIDHPSEMLKILGESLPTVVGYFIALLITKVMAGLPLVILRLGALGRMCLLRLLFAADNLTQRELDQVYRRENVLYGWEYPSQLLVIVICFTYAVICPIILPVGAVYFIGALVVYKKQILYVYTPVYESGGSFFPDACDRTLFGLMCGQLTLIGYTTIRQSYYEPLFLLPLPVFTVWVMTYFRRHYAGAGITLSLERAMECDRISDLRASIDAGLPFTPGLANEERSKVFNREAYRQPVLSVHAMEPMSYRRGVEDDCTKQAREKLRKLNGYANMGGDKPIAFVHHIDEASTERELM